MQLLERHATSYVAGARSARLGARLSSFVARARPQRLRGVYALGVLGVLTIVVTAPERAEAARVAPTWRLSIWGVPHPGPSWFSMVTFVAGMLALAYAWFGLGAYAADASLPLRERTLAVVRGAGLWMVPTLLGPPLLSNDVYSYAAQGEFVSHGWDPTRVGPVFLGGGPIQRVADSVWWHNPSPYGPIWNKLAGWVVSLSGHDPAVAVWGFRVLVLLGIALAGVALYDLARQLGTDPAVALALGLANPLVIIHLVGGVHNDALMIGLMLAGLALARRHRFVAAVVLLTLATAVKVPAAAALVYVGWAIPAVGASKLRRMVTAGAVASASMVVIAALSALWGMSMGWLGALRGTSKIMSTFAPVTVLGMAITDLLGLAGIHGDRDTIVGLFRLAGLLAAAGTAWWLLHHSGRIGLERCLGMTLLLVVLLGPVLWPWYVPMALIVLAASGLERARPAITVCSVAIGLFVWPTAAVDSVSLDQYKSIIDLGIVVLVTLLSAGAQWLAGEPPVPAVVDRWWRRRRELRAQRSATPAPGPTALADSRP